MYCMTLRALLTQASHSRYLTVPIPVRMCSILTTYNQVPVHYLKSHILITCTLPTQTNTSCILTAFHEHFLHRSLILTIWNVSTGIILKQNCLCIPSFSLCTCRLCMLASFLFLLDVHLPVTRCTFSLLVWYLHRHHRHPILTLLANTWTTYSHAYLGIPFSLYYFYF